MHNTYKGNISFHNPPYLFSFLPPSCEETTSTNEGQIPFSFPFKFWLSWRFKSDYSENDSYLSKPLRPCKTE